MQRRNWAQLSRLLVDAPDLAFDNQGNQDALNEVLLAICGEGVLATQQNTSPCVITMNGSSLGGSVGAGSCVAPTGQLITVAPSGSFNLPTADPTHARWDLLVAQYQMIGNTPIPQPSNPANTVSYNIGDGFDLAIVEGTPSSSPAYPSKGTLDVILAGIKVPAAATVGTSCTVDLTQREFAFHNLKPTQQILSGSGTYTPSASVLYFRVRMKGAGGGGGGIGNSTKNGGFGGSSLFGPAPSIDRATAAGGGGGFASADTTIPAPGQGGSPGISTLGVVFTQGFSQDGSLGGSAIQVSGVTCYGGIGGAGSSGGGGGPQNPNSGAAFPGDASSGSGGGGSSANGAAGGGGAAGGTCDFYVTNISGSYPYSVGVGGTAGDSGAGAGANGGLIIDEFYQ